jgi:hypothetical protein
MAGLDWVAVFDSNYLIETLLHETGHALDIGVLKNVYTPNLEGFRYSPDYWNAVQADAALPSDTNDLIESLADLHVLTVFDNMVPLGLSGINPNASQVINQVRLLRQKATYAGDYLYPFGRCNSNKSPPSPLRPIGSIPDY